MSMLTIFLLGINYGFTQDSVNNENGVQQEILHNDAGSYGDIFSQNTAPYAYACHPTWTQYWDGWYHHHIYWNGYGWIHQDIKAAYVYHSGLRQYVWACTWVGCDALNWFH